MSRTRLAACKQMLMGWAFALSLAAQAAAPAANAATQPAQENERLLEGAVQAIQAGHPESAIKDFLDPLIAGFEAQVKPDGPLLFSAGSPVESLLYLGIAAATGKNGEKARAATVLDGSWATALQLKGYALVELKRYDEAKRVLRRGTEIAPMHAALWSELGNLLQDQKNWPEAMAAYQQAETAATTLYGTDVDPKQMALARALRGQGFVLVETGDLDKAQALYERCLKLNSEDAAAKNELAYVLNLRNKTRL